MAFAIPLALLAFTGLETVANLAAETREPGRTLPRSLFAGIGGAVIVTVLVSLVALSAYPAHPDPGGPGGYASDLGTDWLRAPLVGLAMAFDGELPAVVVDALRVAVGLTGTVILIVTITTSFSGAGRLAYSLGRHDMLPRPFALLNRRTLISPASIVSAAVISSALLGIAILSDEPVEFLASLYSFGVLIAFTAAQIAVVRLRFTEPELERPFRVPGNVRVRGTPVPIAALIGMPLTLAIFVASLTTHEAARIAGPIWLLIGGVVYVSSRLSARETLLGRVTPAVGDLVPEIEGAYTRILVPMKIGPIGEEVLSTAIKLAEEHACAVTALYVIRVPLGKPLDAELVDAEEEAEASLAEAKLLGVDHGVRGRRHRGSGPRHRRGDRRRGARARCRPGGHGLLAALAAPVPLLQPDRRLRAPQGALRSDGHRVPPGRAGRGRSRRVTTIRP